MNEYEHLEKVFHQVRSDFYVAVRKIYGSENVTEDLMESARVYPLAVLSDDPPKISLRVCVPENFPSTIDVRVLVESFSQIARSTGLEIEPPSDGPFVRRLRYKTNNLQTFLLEVCKNES